MGKSSAPQPTNPMVTAAASTATNVGTAVANAHLGNVNQVTPDGSLTYSQTGTYDWRDPLSGAVYKLPQFTATQTLSEQQQYIQDQNRQAQGNLANIANDRSAFLKDYLGNPIDTSGAPGLISNPGLKTEIGGGYDTNFSRDIGGNFSNNVNLATSYAGADDFSADRQRVEDALWQRGATGRAQEEEALRSRLMNSGLREGSAAWNSEMERLGRQVADERTGVMLASGQEQSRLVGLSQQAAQFGNEANLAMANFGNNASLQQAQFGSQQQGQQNAAALAQAGFGNDAAMQNASFQNSARAQGLQEAYAQRNQPLNEILGLMSGTQVQNPNLINPNTGKVADTDVASIFGNYDKARLASWQANQQSGAGGLIGNLISGGTRLGTGLMGI